MNKLFLMQFKNFKRYHNLFFIFYFFLNLHFISIGCMKELVVLLYSNVHKQKNSLNLRKNSHAVISTLEKKSCCQLFIKSNVS